MFAIISTTASHAPIYRLIIYLWRSFPVLSSTLLSRNCSVCVLLIPFCGVFIILTLTFSLFLIPYSFNTRTLKKVQEGRTIFRNLIEEAYSNTTVSRDKLHQEIQKEIKKLQRLRNAIIGYIQRGDIKDKNQLEQAKSQIEDVSLSTIDHFLTAFINLLYHFCL